VIALAILMPWLIDLLTSNGVTGELLSSAVGAAVGNCLSNCLGPSRSVRALIFPD
jgi:hypothetical protein